MVKKEEKRKFSFKKKFKNFFKFGNKDSQKEVKPKKMTGKKAIKKKNILKNKKNIQKRTKTKKRSLKKIVKIKKLLEKKIDNKKNKFSKRKEKDLEKKTIEKTKYILTGIKGFDALFAKGRGLPSGASILVEGGPGSGKTIFCLATINNLCSQGKKGLYMSFEEPEERLIRHMEAFGWKAQQMVDKGLLRVRRFDAIDVSRSIEALLSAAKKELLIEVDPVFFPEDFDPDFIVIDSLTSIASAFSGQESRFRIYMEQLFRYLEKNKITNFLIREVSSPSHIGTTFKEQGEAVSFLSDGIIVLYNVIYSNGKRGSGIEILKMRGTDFQKKIVEMKIIDGKGLEVYPDKVLSRNTSDFNLT